MNALNALCLRGDTVRVAHAGHRSGSTWYDFTCIGKLTLYIPQKTATL